MDSVCIYCEHMYICTDVYTDTYTYMNIEKHIQLNAMIIDTPALAKNNKLI